MGGFGQREHAISADLSQLRGARQFAEAAAADFGVDGEARHMVKLAMSEAVTNAIQHGSSSASDVVRVEAVEEEGALVFYVSDEGHFRPMASRGERAGGGRGLDFVRRLMDEMDVRPSSEGTTLRFTKRP